VFDILLESIPDDLLSLAYRMAGRVVGDYGQAAARGGVIGRLADRLGSANVRRYAYAHDRACVSGEEALAPGGYPASHLRRYGSSYSHPQPRELAHQSAQMLRSRAVGRTEREH